MHHHPNKSVLGTLNSHRPSKLQHKRPFHLIFSERGNSLSNFEKVKKNKVLLQAFAHAFVWIIVVSFTFLLTQQMPFPRHEEKMHIMPVFVSSLFLILVFYFNYFILIPRLLFKNRYLIYTLCCAGCIAIKFLVPILIMSSFPKPPPMPVHGAPFPFMMEFAFSNSVLMYVVIFLASIGLRLNNRWKQTEKERLQSEISSLKSQINPHFLFNTLNSIYAETLGKADGASEMILKLAEIMRYTITEANEDKVSLQKEFDYVTNYIELQKIRLASKAKLEYVVNGDATRLQIAPFLLIPFIENAFKYGVNSEQNSFIRIALSIANNELKLWVTNKKVKTENSLHETFGLGVANTRKRLSLLYPDKSILAIYETEDDYSVSLFIKLG